MPDIPLAHPDPGSGTLGGMRELWTTTIDGPFGPMTAGASERGVCLLSFGSPDRLRRELSGLGAECPDTIPAADHPHLARLALEIDQYFDGARATFSVPLDLPGTAWQRRVWRALTEIPCGRTLTYGTLAAHVGNARAARAVGLANGANRVAIVVPCHRVVATGGGLGGYAGGLERKSWLLDHEAAMTGSGTLFGPTATR